MSFNKIKFRTVKNVLLKTFSLFLCALFMLQQTIIILPAFADSNITGVTPVDGNTYNINPTSIVGSTGFRSYTDFSVGAGDVANLIYGPNYSKFVNLVQNQISIYGILNTMKNGSFYNGHAIFVSPNGMVVGASGVINVGALSVYTPSHSTFDTFYNNLSPSEDLASLKKDSQGVIQINGKVFARDGVDIHGKTVSIGNNTTSNATTGIFSGLNSNTYNQAITTSAASETLFNSLVSTNGLNKGITFTNENGKIVIKAQSTTTDGSIATSSVTAQNAYLDGNGIDISATSSSTLDSTNAATITDTILDNIIAGKDTTYTGAVSSAVVNILSGAKLVSNSTTNNSGISLSSSATSETTVEDKKLDFWETGFSYGTATTSKVNVASGASINTSKDLTVSANSSNTLDVTLKSKNNFLDAVAGTDSSIRFVILNASTNADTQTNLDSGSSIKAKNVTVSATNETSNSISAVTDAEFGSDESTPSVGGTVVLNNTSVNTKAEIDTTVDTVNAGDVNVDAQTMYLSSVAANASASGNSNAGKTQTAGQQSGATSNLTKIKNIYTQYTSAADQNSTTQTVFSGSGALAINKSNLTTTATIGKNSTIKADNVTINANTIDLTANQAIAASKDAKASVGLAAVFNKQTDNTNANIEDGSSASDAAKVTANNALNINSTTQMPQNLGSIEFLLGAFSTARGVFTSDFWNNFTTNVEKLGSDSKEIYLTFKDDNWKDTFGIAGFFNNYAQSSGSGESTGIAGSVVYSNVVNSTIARIGDYTTIGSTSSPNGSIIVNAANSINYNNLAGNLESLYKISGTTGAVGVGGSLVLSDNKQNAKAQIGNNVTVNANNDVALDAATSQTLINIAVGGSSSEKAAITGSIDVVLDGGTTETSVGNSVINAKSLSLNSGTATINKATRSAWDAAENAYTITGWSDTSDTISDSSTFITIAGAISKQSQESSGGATESSGAAVGASVGVVYIDRAVNASIADGANITLDNALNVLSNTSTNGINVAVAGSFAGGVSTKKQDQESANNGTGGTSNSNQKMSNTGGWIDQVDSILSTITGKTLANQATTSTIDPKTNSTSSNALKTSTTSNGTSSSSGSNSIASNLSGTSDLNSSTTDSTTATSNLSVAAAGSVNAQIYKNNASASIGSAKVKANTVKVDANQNTSTINVSTGIAQSKSVGAGAAINLTLNMDSTTANIGNATSVANEYADVDTTGTVDVHAKESANELNVALGVGATTGSSNNTSSTKAAVGGSFNASALTNSVNSYIGQKANITAGGSVNTKAESVTNLLNVAGGVAVNVASSSTTSIGAGIAANINVFAQDTEAKIMDNANITSSGAVGVDADNTDKVLSIGVAGTVVSGGGTAYTFTGVLGTDIIVNTTSALISKAIIDSNSLSVTADNNITNYNLAGAVSFTNSQSSKSVGVGAVVDVIANNTIAGISDSTVKSGGNLDVKASQYETLRFLAFNGSVANTGGGLVLGLNGVINVLNSTIDSYITGSDITKATNTNVISTYDTDIEGITVVGTFSTGSSAASGNLVANVVNNNILSGITGSDVNASEYLNVKSDADETIVTVPAALAIAASSGAGVAADVAADIITNTTSATISGKKKTDGKVSSTGGINIEATDDTTVKTRGGTIGISPSGSAVSGSIIVDVIVKNVNASIGDSTEIAASSGDVDVKASATNTFGIKNTIDFNSLSGITSLISSGTSLSDVASLSNWEMTFSVAGGSNAGVSGSLIAKTINNTVAASVGTNSKVTGKSVDVIANNETYIRAIVGNISAASSAAVGASIFVNTLVGSTTASAATGSEIITTGIPSSSDPTAGDVNIAATSTEDVKTIMVSGSGSSSVAVNGSLNVNTIVDSTKALVNGAKIDATGDIGVTAEENNNISSFNLSGSGSGTASVGVTGYVNTYANTVEASINDSKSSDNSKKIEADGKVNVNAKGSDSFGAIMGIVSIGGNAGIAGLVLVNTVSATINSYISNSIVTSTNADVEVSSNYDFNKTKYAKLDSDGDGVKDTTNISAYLTDLEDGSGEYDSSDLVGNYLPIVSAINVTGSANAAIGITAVTNTIINNVNAYVSGNSQISSSTGLKVLANSNIITYDAIAAFSVAGEGAAVNGSFITNTILGTTQAYLDKSTVSTGDVDVEAKEAVAINEGLIGISVVGVGGAVSPIIATNTLVNTVSSRITDSKINNSNNVTVKSNSDNTISTLSIAGAGAGVGGAVTGDVATNVYAGKTEAYIAGTNADDVVISKGNVNVEANSDLTTFDLTTAALVSGVGADVGINVITNVVANDVYSYIKNAKLDANTLAKVKSDSTVNLYNIVASAGINGIGASIGGTIITNVIDNDVDAYVLTSKIAGGKLDISAIQNTTLSGGATSINAGGLSVAGSVHAITNVFLDRVNAYVQDSVITNNTGITVAGTSNEIIDFSTLSGAGAGLGGVAGSVLTNVVDNDLASYISGGSIASTGDVKVTANQTVTMNNLSGGVQIGAAAVGARTIVNTLTNTAKAYIDNTGISDSGSITVSSTSTENITNNNYSASGGGVAAGVGVLTNVIENTTQAYINAKSKTVNTSGALSVTANDTLTMSNTAGIASFAAGYGAAMSLNINIINNAVLAELLSASNGSISANSVGVTSTSTMNLELATASAAGGYTGLGLAGTIGITSIGDKVSGDSDYNSYTSGSTTKAKDNSSNSTAKSKLAGNVDYNRDGSNDYSYNYSDSGTPTNLDAVTKGTVTAKDGTIANIKANVTSANAVNVNATNTIKGIGDNTFNITNATVAGGTVAAGASVLVTDMKYKTIAKITGGKVKSNAGKDVSLNATNTISTETNAAAGTIGAVALGGNVAIFKNKAATKALISDSVVQTTGNVSVKANSTDTISARAISGTAGLATVSATVALAKTENNTTAQVNNSTINGGDSSTKAGNVDVKATNTSTLTSEMESGSVSGYSFNALVNQAKSSAVTSAIISNSSNINSNYLNLISSTGGISATTKMYVGSLTFIGGSVTVSGADVAATFNSTVDGNITANNDVNIKAGVNSSDEVSGGTISAAVESYKGTASVASATKATQSANARANTNITVSDKSTINAKTINILSALNRTAKTGQASLTISGISLSDLTLDAEANGSSNITINGDLIANTIDMEINDTNTATTQTIAATISLVSGSLVTAKAIVGSNANITIGSTGSLKASDIDVTSKSTRTAGTSNSSASASLGSIGVTLLDVEANGSSTIDLDGALTASTIDASINDTNTANAKMLSAKLSFVNGAANTVQAIVGSTNTINQDSTGSLNAGTINLTSTSTKNARIQNADYGAQLIGVGVTSMKSQASGSSGINMAGKVRGSSGSDDSSATSLTMKVNDTSSAQNDSANFDIGLVSGKKLTIWSTADSQISNTIGGDIKSASTNLTNNLNRTATANSASSSISLGSISSMELFTRFGNGVNSIFSGKIAGSSLTVDSNLTNNAKVDMKDSTKALAAFGNDGAANNIYGTNQNYVKFNSGSDIDLTGKLDTDVDLINNVSMTGKTDSNGFFSAKGNSLKNNIQSYAGIEFNSAKIHAKQMSAASETAIINNTPLYLSNSFRGFASSSEATISNTVSQQNDIKSTGSTNVDVDEDLTISENARSNFAQKVETSGSGFSSSNSAHSYLTVNNTNNVNFLDTSNLSGKNLTINLDSNNTLTSLANAEAHHFAGDPGASSYINLNINNNVTVGSGSKLSSGNQVSVNYLKNSTNNLKQDAYVYAEAAVATANWGGGINYNTNNKLTVNTNGMISSDKDVSLNYANGSNTFSSRVAYKKVSRILFGIPITKKGSSSRINIANTNSLTLDGTIQAGESSYRYMKINQDGSVSSSTEGFEDKDYTLVDAANISGKDATDSAKAEIQSQIDALNSKKVELDSTSSENQAQIKVYQAEIDTLIATLNALNSTISDDTVANTMKANIQGSTIGGDASKISQTIFDNIWNQIQTQNANDSQRQTILNNYVVTPATYDSKGNLKTAAVMLSDAQKTTINNAFTAENNKFGTNSVTGASTYNGQIIADELTESYKTEVGNSKINLEAARDKLSTINTDIANNIASLKEEILNLNDQKAYLDTHPLSDINISNSSVNFNDLITKPSKIEITGLSPFNITGNGNFKIFGPSLVIDNYSPRYLIFKNINLDNAITSGLIINGQNYSHIANTGTVIGYGNVKLIKDYGSIPVETRGTITINNYYDHMDPVLPANAIASNIIFNGFVTNSSNAFNVFNDSGDITFNNSISANSMDIVASQGNISYKGGGNFNLKSGSRLIAGQDVNVKANNITINGTVKAGNANRSLTITDAMLSNLIVDPTTGEKNMINLGGSEKSAYLNSTNNIKALYKDGKIILFNTNATSGSINFDGTVSGSGTLTYSDGYGSVVINNQTNKELTVNNINNNYEAATFTNKGSIAASKITQNKYTSAKTNISSNGLVNVLGQISSGNISNTINGTGSLNISSTNGVNINNKLNPLGEQINTIDATGTVDISNTGSKDIDILGKITNRKGNTTITNNGSSNISVGPSGVIENGQGNVKLLAQNSTGNIIVKGNINNTVSGNTEIINNNSGASGIKVSGNITNNDGNLTVINKGLNGINVSGAISNLVKGNSAIINDIGSAGGIDISGTIDNTLGSTNIANNGAGGVQISGTVTNSAGFANTDLTISNAVDGGITVKPTGTIENTGNGNTSITNNGTGGITVAVNGQVKNGTGSLTLLNTGLGDTTIAGALTNTSGNLSILNTNTGESGINISKTGTTTNQNGNTTISNTGLGGIRIAGTTTNTTGNTEITNETGSAGGIDISGTVSNTLGKTTIANNGNGGINVSGTVSNTTGSNDKDITVINTVDGGITITPTGIIENTGNGNTSITNNGTGGITVEVNGQVKNGTGSLTLLNTGLGDTTIAGALTNASGNLSILNTNTGESGITIESTGTAINTDGTLKIQNFGTKGIRIAGKTTNSAGNTEVINETSGNIILGHSSTDNNIATTNGNTTITNKNGSILNAGVDKTLINVDNGNLKMATINGDIGSYDINRKSRSSLTNKYGIEAATRDPSESFNVKVTGTFNDDNINGTGKINAAATSIDSTDRLINLRAKSSDMNVDQIKADGNVILTAADWREPDKNPPPKRESYYKGYSILNASSDDSHANIEGKNISLIASYDIGQGSGASLADVLDPTNPKTIDSSKWLTYNQTSTGWLSAEAEHDLFIKGASDSYDTNIWQIIAKRGNMGIELPGNTVIREITAGNDLMLINRGTNLTIYDLGKMPHMMNPKDDILYPHDRIALSDVIPQSIGIAVLDINPKLRNSDTPANSTLNIYNAYVRGLNDYQNDGKTRKPDVILRADNIIAHAYNAPSSVVNTLARPHGFNASLGRDYADNPLDPTAPKTLRATGFNAYGRGDSLVFDIRGISPQLVRAIQRDVNSRNYYNQPKITTIPQFTNPFFSSATDYKINDLTLSVNSNHNRGSIFNYLYANNAYFDTTDSYVFLRDAIINNYGEFRNGNGGIGSGNRWLTVVDNDYRRFIHHQYGTPVTLQLYTQKTGSFYLKMSYLISLDTSAPVVYYNPYEVANIPHTENSFHRLTYKEDEIQEFTTTPDFKEVDKDTYKPVKRDSLRYKVQKGDITISSNGIISDIIDISGGGMAVKFNGNLTVGNKFTVDISYNKIRISQDVKVIRIGQNIAGLKFLNIDKATANKISYISMLLSQREKPTRISQR